MKKTFIIIFLIIFAINFFSKEVIDFFSDSLDSLEFYIEKNDTIKSLRFFNVLKEIDPSKYEPYYFIGFLYYQNNNLDKAIHYLTIASNLKNDEEVFYLLNKCLLEKDDKKFLEKINYSIKYFPNSIKLMKLKLFYFERKNLNDSTLFAAQKILSLDDNDIDGLFSIANYYHKIKNYNLAENYISQVLNIDEKNQKHIFLAAEIFHKLKKYDKSNNYFKKLLNTEYDFYALNRIIDNFYEKNFYDSVEVYCFNTLKGYPDSLIVLKKLLNLYNRTKNFPLLLKMDSILTNIEKYDQEIFENLGREFFKSDSLNLSKKYYDKILEKNQKYFSKESVQNYILLNELDISEKIISRMDLKNFNDSIFFFKFKGIIKYKKNENDSSEFYFEKLYLLNDKDTTNIKYLTTIYSKNKKFLKLSDLIQSIKDVYPDLYERLKARYLQ
ncbi:MAG: hypothetical protein ABIN35_01685 [candidate division WOR-3 bacterium]